MELSEKSDSAKLQEIDEPLKAAAESEEIKSEGEEIKPEGEEAVEQQTVRYSLMTKEQLIDALAGLVEKPVDEVRDDVNAVKHAFYALRKQEIEKEQQEFIDKGNELAAFAVMPDPTEDQLRGLLNKYKEKKAEQLAAIEAEMQSNLEKKREILKQIAGLAEDTDNINKHYQQFQQLQQDFKEVGVVPPSEDKALWKDYQSQTEQFYDLWKMNKELRDYDFKKNLDAKQQLCEEAETLAAEEDVIAAFKKLQDLHNKWREIGPVVKELREDLWKRFKDASTVINKKHQAYFDEVKEHEKENEAAKLALCEEVEAIDTAAFDSSEKWNDATKKVIALQEQWKTIGFATRKVNNDLFLRFRKKCDAFFAEKSSYFKNKRVQLADNLAKKQKLCERAEALKDSTDWKKATDEFVALQKEWKAIGTVPKKDNEVIWKRFISACDYFFDNKSKNTSSVKQEERSNLAAKQKIVAELKAIEDGMSKDDVRKLLKSLSSQYQEIGHVPYKEKDKIYEEYKNALNAVYKKFDLNENRSRFENFASNVNEISSDKNKLYRERERLVRQYEQKKAEIKTSENNFGFFTITSKSGNSVLKEMERRIARAKEDLLDIEKKIELIDEKL